jgi:hypothetical protein
MTRLLCSALLYLGYYRVVLYYSFRSKVVQNLHDKIPRIIELFQVLASNYDNITDRKNKHFDDIGQRLSLKLLALNLSPGKSSEVYTASQIPRIIRKSYSCSKSMLPPAYAVETIFCMQILKHCVFGWILFTNIWSCCTLK